MAKQKICGLLFAACLALAPAARAQEGFPPAGPFPPGVFSPPPGFAEPVPPFDPPGPSTAVQEQQPPRPNAFGGETEPAEPGVIQLDAEYLLWWVKDGPLATPLATTSTTPTGGILTSTSGAIGAPGTVVLFGGAGLSYGEISGARLRALWEPEPGIYMEGRGFLLARKAVDFQVASSAAGSPLLARPLFAPQLTPPAEVALYASFPAQASGSLSVSAPTQLGGMQADLGLNMWGGEGYRVDFLAGYRFLELKESLRVNHSLRALVPNAVPFNGATLGPGNMTVVNDLFTTRNRLNGADLGTRALFWVGSLRLTMESRVAFGQTSQELSIGGTSTLVTPVGTTTVPGGVLAVPSNSGTFTRNSFVIVPEVGANLEFHVNRALALSVGYNFLYWSSVVRPGEQLNRVVDTRQIPTSPAFNAAAVPLGPPRPFQQNSFYASGLTFGLQLDF